MIITRIHLLISGLETSLVEFITKKIKAIIANTKIAFLWCGLQVFSQLFLAKLNFY
jgi:hypothetical protein